MLGPLRNDPRRAERRTRRPRAEGPGGPPEGPRRPRARQGTAGRAPRAKGGTPCTARRNAPRSAYAPPCAPPGTPASAAASASAHGRGPSRGDWRRSPPRRPCGRPHRRRAVIRGLRFVIGGLTDCEGRVASVDTPLAALPSRPPTPTQLAFHVDSQESRAMNQAEGARRGVAREETAAQHDCGA